MKPFVRQFQGTVPTIHPEAFLAENAIVIGDVVIGADSSVWYGCVLRGDDNFIRVGERSNIQDGTIVHINSDEFSTTIGNDVTIGHGCIIHACVLEDRSFVGMGSTVLDGAVVESDAMVAAGSLVPPGKIVRSGEVWSGVPAKFWREMRDTDRGEGARIAVHYAALARKYKAG